MTLLRHSESYDKCILPIPGEAAGAKVSIGHETSSLESRMMKPYEVAKQRSRGRIRTPLPKSGVHNAWVLEYNISVEIIKQVNNLIELSIPRKYGIGSR